MTGVPNNQTSNHGGPSAATTVFYCVCGVFICYLLAFSILVLLPGVANNLRSVGVSEDLLTKIFYPLLYLIR